MVRVVSSAAELRERIERGAPRAVVMTMGALHEGHAELIRQARVRVGPSGSVVTTVFVNPTQFGAGEDFQTYPRTLEADVEVCSQAGADCVFAPSAEEVYGPSRGFRPDSVTIDPGPLGEILEGASRPGHFRGVLTVVAKLLALTGPDTALFGEKDYQQLTLIRRMAADLSMPVEIVGVPTVREPDGLARSSRNRYLTAEERPLAAFLPRALNAVAQAAAEGADDPVAAGRTALAESPGIDLDYLVLMAPDLSGPAGSGPARALVAARVGRTRLIDNVAVEVVRP